VPPPTAPQLGFQRVYRFIPESAPVFFSSMPEELSFSITRLPDVPITRSHAPLPPPLPSQIGVYLRGVHPRPSQIGVGFSVASPNWREFAVAELANCYLPVAAICHLLFCQRALRFSPEGCRYSSRLYFRNHARTSSHRQDMSFATLCLNMVPGRKVRTEFNKNLRYIDWPPIMLLTWNIAGKSKS
jgi:hypothetical protein